MQHPLQVQVRQEVLGYVHTVHSRTRMVAAIARFADCHCLERNRTARFVEFGVDCVIHTLSTVGDLHRRACGGPRVGRCVGGRDG